MQLKFTLEQARNYKGLTIEAMANELKVSRSSYIGYEKYKTPMRIDKGFLFAEIVGLSLDDLIFFNPKLHFKCS